MYATQANGLLVTTDSTIVLNVAMSTIGSASLRTALFTFALCTKSAIVVVAPGSFYEPQTVYFRIFFNGLEKWGENRSIIKKNVRTREQGLI